MANLSADGLDWAVEGTSYVRGEESGDVCVVTTFAGGTLIALIDALGHGPEAAQVANRARRILERFPQEPPRRLLVLCHEELRGTRGAVLSIASIRPRSRTVIWAGVGNVEAWLLRSTPGPRDDDTLIAPGGVVGAILPPVSDRALTTHPRDLLVMATDGIRPTFPEQLDRALAARPLAMRILARHATGRDDAMVVVARLA